MLDSDDVQFIEKRNHCADSASVVQQDTWMYKRLPTQWTHVAALHWLQRG